ncbi:hypothetical protein BJ322DRAFT_1216957 [Thelephora terrestris]|uniref:Uncharacterized protein n=1 Tax=Thelephora terrestris TaxID=56493 RepID=A0A9P6LAR6_9AGAM|nr:hypothetical protein BJ322DRAFT_1216957 [Thelephora terrestris]
MSITELHHGESPGTIPDAYGLDAIASCWDAVYLVTLVWDRIYLLKSHERRNAANREAPQQNARFRSNCPHPDVDAGAMPFCYAPSSALQQQPQGVPLLVAIQLEPCSFALAYAPRLVTSSRRNAKPVLVTVHTRTVVRKGVQSMTYAYHTSIHGFGPVSGDPSPGPIKLHSGVHDPFDLSQQDPPGIEASANGDIDRLHALELLNAAEDASSNVECDSFGLDKRAPFISTAARFGRRSLMALVEGNFIRVLGRVMQTW